MPLAIITGASRGLGLALARELATRNWALVLDARGAAELEAVARELGALTEVAAIPGDVRDETHRRSLIATAGESIDALVNNASVLGPSPQPALASYPLAELERVYQANVFAPLALTQRALPRIADGGAVVNVTSDAAVEPYEGWGGYGSSKAALEQLTAILAVEHPAIRLYAVDPGEAALDHFSAVLAAEEPSLRVWSVDPGDLRTQMHQEAFPGEDISDRPPPEDSVPGLIELIIGALPSGRYRAKEVQSRASAGV